MPLIGYIPRVLSNPDNQARHNGNAQALGLTLTAHGSIPNECAVFIQYRHYTADYRTTREKPFVIYSRHSGTSEYRASYRTLERAAIAARAIEQRIREATA
jgi:hypothetical protein